MPTIEQLVIAIGADPTGLKRGLADSNAAIGGFVRQANQELQGLASSPNTALTGYRFAQDLLTGLTAKFDADKAHLREQFARGLFDESEYRERGFKSAQGFNSALLSGLAEIRGRTMIPPEVEQQLQNALKSDGFKAGDAFVKAAQAQMARLAAGPSDSPLKRFAQSTGEVGKIVDDTTGRFTSLGQRGATALRSVEFGLEQIVSGAGSAEGAARGALRGVGTFAEAFGPVGIVVSALSAGGLALYSFWNEQRQQAEQTKNAFKKSLADLFNAGDIAPLQKRLQELQQGRPSVNAGIDAPEPGSLVVKGGLNALNAQLRAAQQDYETALNTHNFILFTSSQKAIKALQQEIAPIQAAYDDVRRAIFQVPSRVGTDGALPTIQINAKGVAKQAVQDLKDARAQLAALTATISEDGMHAFEQTGFGDRLSATYKEILQQLSKLPDQLGPDALGLKKLLDQNIDALLKDVPHALAQISSVALMPAAPPPVIAIAPPAIESVSRYTAAMTRLNPTLSRLQDAAHAVREMSDAFGHGAENVARFADGVGELAGSIQDVQKANFKSFNGVLDEIKGINGIVAAVVTIGQTIASAFGKSAGERQREAAIDSNTAALERVRSSLDKSFSSGNNLDATRAAIAAYLSPANSAFRKTVEQDAGKSVHADAELSAFLSAFHLTSDQLVALASSYGITLFKNGKVVTDALKDLGDAIGATAASLTTFGSDFASQDAAKQLRDKLFGKTNPQDALARELEELTQFAPSLGKAFQGLDTTTDEGRRQIRSALQALYLEIQSGALSLSDLGGFTDIAQLLEVIGGTSDALDALGSAADEVSGALRNVPQGFKVAAATYAATDALVRSLLNGGGSGNPKGPPTDARPGIPPGATLPASFAFAPGAIVIQGTNKSADQLLDELALAAQRKAAAYGGRYTPADMFALLGTGAAVAS